LNFIYEYFIISREKKEEEKVRIVQAFMLTYVFFCKSKSQCNLKIEEEKSTVKVIYDRRVRVHD